MHTKILTPQTAEGQRSNGFSYTSHKVLPALQTTPLPPRRLNYHLAHLESEELSIKQEDFGPVDHALTKISSSLNLKEIMGTLYQESSHLVDTTNFALAIYDDQTDALAFPIIFYGGQRGKPFLVRRSNIRGLISDTLSQRVPLLVPDLFDLDRPPHYDPIRPAHPIRSWLSVPVHNPLRPQENARGVIIVWNNQPCVFTEQQARQLSKLGPPAAIAIRSIQMHQTSQRQTRELAVVNDIVQTLASTLQLDEVLSRIMKLVEDMLKVEAGALLLTDPTTEALVFQIALGEAERTGRIKQFRLPKGESIASYVTLVSKKPELVTRVDPKQRPFIKLASYLQIEPRNCLYVPLILKEQVIGVLAVLNKTKGTFTQSDVNLLDLIATYAAIAIDNARLHETILGERDRALEIEEEARKELASDLHDGPTQLVSGIMMRLSHCQTAVQKDPSLLMAEFIQMEEMCQEAIHQMRTMLVELLPLELGKHGQGLGAAIRAFLGRRQKEITGAKLIPKIITYHPGGRISRQDPQLEKAVFNIMYETVNNAIKHAQASRIEVLLEETSDMLRTIITDNGKGFDVTKTLEKYHGRGSLGMFNIQERAEALGGRLMINSTLGHGTQISLIVPKSKADRMRNRGTTGQLTLPANMLPMA